MERRAMPMLRRVHQEQKEKKLLTRQSASILTQAKTNMARLQTAKES
jgi:hypothetical protein